MSKEENPELRIILMNNSSNLAEYKEIGVHLSGAELAIGWFQQFGFSNQ